MRIAYLTGEYPRATDTFIQREVAVLRTLGVEVQTFSVRPTGVEHLIGPEQQAERDRTEYLLPPQPAQLLKAHLTLLLTAPRRYGKGLKLAWQMRSPGLRAAIFQGIYFLEAGLLAIRLRQHRIEHLHNHIADSSCTVAMLAATLADLRFSFTLHGPGIFFEPHRWRLDLKIQQALFVSCISHFCRSQAMLFSTQADWPKLHIIHCGIDPKLFCPVSHAPQNQRLLYTGRLAAAKGLPILLEAFRQVLETVPSATLILIGDGPDRLALEQQVTALDLQDHIQFLGYQSQESVRYYLQTTAVFVLPSFTEGLPVALMESLAAGVPVVTTAIAGIGELVTDGQNGFLVPPGAVAPLAVRLQQLLLDVSLRNQLGQAGRAKVIEDFNLYHEGHRLKTVLTATLAGQQVAVRPAVPSPRQADSSDVAATHSHP